MDVLQILKERALELSKGFSAEDFKIRGLWKTDLMFRPNVDERTFNFTYVLAQTLGQGCAYCSPDVKMDEGLMGQDARIVDVEDVGLQIAILDAVYYSLKGNPASSFRINGNSVEKTPLRTKIVVDEVAYQLADMSYKGKRPTVLNVGVVGNFLKEFVNMDYGVEASDFDPNLVDKSINGVTVTHGDHTLELVKKADVAVATGMTLATRTLGDIINTAKEYGTKLVLFAETGANFGYEYCNLGVDSVISEPFPFYIFQGTSIIDVFRRQECPCLSTTK